jgi:hypothetical protein
MRHRVPTNPPHFEIIMLIIFINCNWVANTTYFMLQKFFKSKNISKKLKLILKNAIIDKTLAYALETSTLTKRDSEKVKKR